MFLSFASKCSFVILKFSNGVGLGVGNIKINKQKLDFFPENRKMNKGLILENFLNNLVQKTFSFFL